MGSLSGKILCVWVWVVCVFGRVSGVCEEEEEGGGHRGLQAMPPPLWSVSALGAAAAQLTRAIKGAIKTSGVDPEKMNS